MILHFGLTNSNMEKENARTDFLNVENNSPNALRFMLPNYVFGLT